MRTINNRLNWGMLAMWVVATHCHAQIYTFRNVAGNSTNTYGGATDGTNGRAQFAGPAGVAVDRQGNLFVADQFNCTIREIMPLGTNWVVSTIAGTAGNFSPLRDGTNGHAIFYYPTAIAVDNSGNLFVADQFNNAIRKLTPTAGRTNWVVTTIAGNGIAGFADGTNSAARFYGPAGIAVDANDNVFVADQFNNVIRKITPVTGTTNWVTTTIAGGGPTNSGVADGNNTAAQFNLPTGVAVDAGGNLFVADQDNNDIRKLTPSGTNWVVTTIAGHGPNKPGAVDGTNTAQFTHPAGVAVDTNGNIYVADEVNDTIRKVALVGTNWVTTTIGGQAGISGTNNGARTSALFNYPFGLAVDAKGSVFVADSDNNTIRIGYPPPMILNSAPSIGVNQGQFGFNLAGPTGQLVIVEASSDMMNWVPIWTNTFSAAPLSFSDPQGLSAGRFYRVRVP